MADVGQTADCLHREEEKEKQVDHTHEYGNAKSQSKYLQIYNCHPIFANMFRRFSTKYGDFSPHLDAFMAFLANTEKISIHAGHKNDS